MNTITMEEVQKYLDAGYDVFLVSKKGTEEEVHTSNETGDDNDTDFIKVTDIIKNLGIQANLKGYNYLREAILLCINAPMYLEEITKMLYPTIARMFNTTPSRVERAIRHAIEKAWYTENDKMFKEFFNYSLSNENRPTNSQFIATIADRFNVKKKTVK